MKKLLTLFTLLLTVCSGAWATDYVLSGDTKTSDDKVQPMTFTSNTLSFSVKQTDLTDGTDKLAGAGINKTEKYRTAKTYNITVPSNLNVTSITFYGYSNDNTKTGYISAINGAAPKRNGQTITTITGETFPTKNNDYVTYTYDATKDANNIVSFQATGTSGNSVNQIAVIITITGTYGYTITYDANGGTGTIANSTGTNITLSDGTGFTAPTGYTFAGWNTANDGSGTSYTAGQTGVNATLNLYATWTQDGSINANTGSANTTFTATLNATSIAVAAAPTKDDNSLTGYWTDATGGTKIANADGSLVENTDYTDEDGKWDNSGDAPSLYAQWEETVYYTVTLNPNGGEISDATGWTSDNGQYKKTDVASGTKLTLPTFTKENRTLLTWRDASSNEYSSPVTVTSDLIITAIWGKEKEAIIYSWESPEGTAIETGGTATNYNNNTAVDGNTRVNYANTANGTTYYTLSLSGKDDYSTDHIRIALNNNIKAGDKVKVTAYYTKNSDADAAPRMDTQSGTQIFAESTNLPNIYSGGSPVLRTYTVPSGIDTDAIKLTRNKTKTTTFITKLQIVRPSIAEEITPTIPSSGWGSYCSPYALDFSVAATECEAYVVSAYDVENLTVTYAKQTGIIPAGTGILLKGDAGATSIVLGSGAGSAPAVNKLRGFTTATEYTKTGETRYLGLSGGNWKEMNEGMIPANKAVLEITSAELTTLQGKLADPDAKFTIILDDEPSGETDGIRSIENGRLRIENSDYYNLAGQRVGKDYKGIVIVNGKKYVRK